jgi:hypothetical protein
MNTKKSQTADEHRLTQIRRSRTKDTSVENLSAYIRVNLRFDLVFLSSRPFVSIRG